MSSKLRKHTKKVKRKKRPGGLIPAATRSWALLRPLFICTLLAASFLLSGCQPASATHLDIEVPAVSGDSNDQNSSEGAEQPIDFTARPTYSPGELVAYTAQPGDTLPALASHFNTTIAEILEANPFIPADATTMPPGMPMQIPIYYLPFWGSSYQLLPDSLFVNGPSQVGFDTTLFLEKHNGWLKNYTQFAAGRNRTGGAIVDYVAQNFSISPRLLLAVLEYQTRAVTEQVPPSDLERFPLGYSDRDHKGLYLQLVWAANKLNNAYYGWRGGVLTEFDLKNGRLERPDPWQNAGSVGLQYYFAQVLDAESYAEAVSSNGFAQTYRQLFGDPWENNEPHIPGSLEQPELTLPFEPRKVWAYTGGPHTGWGTGQPLAALDFAPPTDFGGCTASDEWATAMAPGVVTRSETGIVVLDLDKDMDERTGWVIFYLHVGTEGRAPIGTELERGDPVGHPSCEGGTSTGSHVHIARKYNGEWMLAEGPLAFNLEGWVAYNGTKPYQGTLKRLSRTVNACECSNKESFIQAGNQ